MKRPATPTARKLLKKLSALAEAPGTPAEGEAARSKLARLLKRYDFTLPDVTREGLFAGAFQPATDARPVMEIADMNLASWVKWAIEEATGIRCLFRDSALFAQSTSRTADRFAGIGRTIADGFTGLWGQFQTFPAVSVEDRGIFLRGLYDGMMNAQKPEGELLPGRSAGNRPKRAKRKAVGHVAGISLHPYAVALELGKQIRFNVPLPEVSNQLEAMRPVEIAG